jgi:hypothetical protein
MPALDMELHAMHVASLVDAMPTIRLERDQQKLVRYLTDEMGPGWATWPSYVGEIQEDMSGAPGIWSMDDRLQVWRFWSGVPVDVIGMETAVAVVEACQKRMEHSHWEMLERYASLLEEVGMPPDPKTDPDAHLSEEEVEILDIEDTMRKDGLWEENGPGDGQVLPYESMDMLLDGHPQALRTWKKLLVTSRASTLRAADSIPPEDRAWYIYNEREYDPWL